MLKNYSKGAKNSDYYKDGKKYSKKIVLILIGA